MFYLCTVAEAWGKYPSSQNTPSVTAHSPTLLISHDPHQQKSRQSLAVSILPNIITNTLISSGNTGGILVIQQLRQVLELGMKLLDAFDLLEKHLLDIIVCLGQFLLDLKVGRDQVDELIKLLVDLAEAPLGSLALIADQLPQVAGGEEGSANEDTLSAFRTGGAGSCLVYSVWSVCRAVRASKCDALIQVLARGSLLLYKFVEGSRNGTNALLATFHLSKEYEPCILIDRHLLGDKLRQLVLSLSVLCCREAELACVDHGYLGAAM